MKVGWVRGGRQNHEKFFYASERANDLSKAGVRAKDATSKGDNRGKRDEGVQRYGLAFKRCVVTSSKGSEGKRLKPGICLELYLEAL